MLVLPAAGAAQTGAGTFSSPTRQQLTCLLPGYDSLICYAGTDYRSAIHGTVTDSGFLANIFQQVKATGNPIVLKLGGGADVITNLRQIMDLAVSERTGYLIDSTNAAEEYAFRVETPEIVRTMLRHPDQPPAPLSVTMPKVTTDTPATIPGIPPASQISIEISGDSGPFVYIGNDRKNGRYYTTGELKAFLLTKRSEKNLTVILKAVQDSDYHQFVDVLDALKSADIQHYSLVNLPNP